MPFLPFVYGYPSSSPRAHCTPNKSVPTLCYTRRPGPVYTGPYPKVPWISEDRLLSVTETTTAAASYHCRLEGTVPVIRVSPYMALNSSKRLPSTTRAITCNVTLSESDPLQTVGRRPVSATIIMVISMLRILQCSKCVTKSNIRNNIQN